MSYTYNPKEAVHSEVQCRTATVAGDIPVFWAIDNFIPQHSITTIAGPTGIGLTTFAMHLTREMAPIRPPHWLTGSEKYPRVLYITGREPGFRLRARLEALGVDLEEVIFVDEVIDDCKDGSKNHRPVACTDSGRLYQICREHKGIGMVIIDNAEDLFHDLKRPTRAKFFEQLSWLQDLAYSRELSVVLLVNTTNLGVNPFRESMLTAMHQYSRSVYLITKDPEEESQRLIFTMKHTAGPSHPTIRFDSRHYVPIRERPTIPELSYDRYVKLLKAPQKRGPSPDSRNYAIEVLRELLKSGQPLRVGTTKSKSRNCLRRLTEAAGLPWGTVLRAKEELGIVSVRDQKRWYWQLPSAEPQPQTTNPEPECAQTPETCAPSRKSEDLPPNVYWPEFAYGTKHPAKRIKTIQFRDITPPEPSQLPPAGGETASAA